MGGPDDEDARAYRWSMPPARATRLSEYRIGYLVDDPACAVSSDEREVLVKAIDGLRAAGVKLEEGWPKGVQPIEQYDVYLTLLYSTFALGVTDDQIDGLRRSSGESGWLLRGQAGRWPSPRRTSTTHAPTGCACGRAPSGRTTSRPTTRS